jgi:GGDEF domain-containing protein
MNQSAVDEHARQRELDTYRVLDTLPDEAFDDVVRLASMLCDAPIALVSLVDRDRQWFKAKRGFDPPATARSEAFCDHAIREPDTLLEVPDTAQDARFSNLELVTGGQARFYAGMPLLTPSGAPIGTVCVLDHEPRTLDARQREALASLARLTMNLLDGRKRERELERSILLAQATVLDGVPTIDAPANAVPEAGYTLALLQVQDFAGVVERRGERTTEKLLQQLDQALEGCLQTGPREALHRVTGDPEFVIVLQGRGHHETLRRLRDVLPGFEREHGLQVLMGTADAERDERLDAVYRRADFALSDEKDRIAQRG